MTMSETPKSRWPSRLLTLVAGGCLAFTFAIVSWPDRLGIRPDLAIYVALTIAALGAVIGFVATRSLVKTLPPGERPKPSLDVVAKAMKESRLIFGVGFAILAGVMMASKYWDGSLVTATTIALGFGAIGGVFGWVLGHVFGASVRAMFQSPRDE